MEENLMLMEKYQIIQMIVMKKKISMLMISKQFKKKHKEED
jgi:hypothetical protein